MFRGVVLVHLERHAVEESPSPLFKVSRFCSGQVKDIFPIRLAGAGDFSYVRLPPREALHSYS